MKTNSRAEANVLRMEFRFLRKRLVTMPTAALFRITITTVGFNTYQGDSNLISSLASKEVFIFSTISLSLAISLFLCNLWLTENHLNPTKSDMRGPQTRDRANLVKADDSSPLMASTAPPHRMESMYMKMF